MQVHCLATPKLALNERACSLCSDDSDAFTIHLARSGKTEALSARKSCADARWAQMQDESLAFYSLEADRTHASDRSKYKAVKRVHMRYRTPDFQVISRVLKPNPKLLDSNAVFAVLFCSPRNCSAAPQPRSPAAPQLKVTGQCGRHMAELCFVFVA